MAKESDYYHMVMVQMDEQFVSELGEELDKYDSGDYPYLVMDVWEDQEIGTVWEIRHHDTPPADYVPVDDTTVFHRFADCQDFYNARDEVLTYFTLSMMHYANNKERENGERK